MIGGSLMAEIFNCLVVQSTLAMEIQGLEAAADLPPPPPPPPPQPPPPPRAVPDASSDAIAARAAADGCARKLAEVTSSLRVSCRMR